MKKYFLLATALAAIVSCSDESFVGDQKLVDEAKNAPISFGFDVPAVTRASGAEAATALGNRFIVYGEKGDITAVAPTSGNLVFPNYQVNYVANTANSTTSNTKNWEYVGYTHSEQYQNNITRDPSSAENNEEKASNVAQTIKFWDYSANNYVFTAVSALDADITNGRVKIQKNEYGSTAYDKGYTITLAKSGDDPSYTYPTLNKLYFSDREVIAQGSGSNRDAKDAYGGYVELTFRNLVSQIRAGIYETVPGYDIIAMKFYVTDGDDEGTDLDETTGKAFGANCPNTKVSQYEGTITVVYYSDSDGALENQPKVTATGIPADDLILGDNFNNLSTSTLLGKMASANDVTWDTNGGTYTEVLPQINNSTNLKLTVDYTLWNSVSGETIEVKGATAEVPAEYLKWKPNYKYTYLFKITYDTNGSTGQGVAGLYPITFDAVQIEAEDGNVEYITTVSEPSITTYAKASAVLTNNEYVTGNNIYVAVEDGSTNPTLTVGDNANLYTVTIQDGAAQEINEASVANALANGTISGDTWTVTDALGKDMVVTNINAQLTADTKIPAADSPTGVDLNLKVAKFAPVVPTFTKKDGLTANTSPVKGLYTRTGEGTSESPYVYTIITADEAKAVDGTDYYEKTASSAGYYVFEYLKAGVAAVLYTAEDAEVIAGTKQVGDEKTPAIPAVKVYKVIKVVDQY